MLYLFVMFTATISTCKLSTVEQLWFRHRGRTIAILTGQAITYQSNMHTQLCCFHFLYSITSLFHLRVLMVTQERSVLWYISAFGAPARVVFRQLFTKCGDRPGIRRVFNYRCQMPPHAKQQQTSKQWNINKLLCIAAFVCSENHQVGQPDRWVSHCARACCLLAHSWVSLNTN